MESPGSEPGMKAAAETKRNPLSKAKRRKPTTNTDAIFVYAWSRGLTFSPDGTELALYSTHSSPRLMVWNMKGKLILDEALEMPQTIGHDQTFEWQADGGGWLINNCLFDRKSKRVVLSVRVPFASDIQPHLLDADYLIGAFGDDRDRLQAIPIPREKLNEALQQMASKAPSYLAPGGSVGLRVELTGLRGDESETRRLIAESLARRLARDGIDVDENQPTVLRFRLSEESEESLPVYQRQSPFDFQGRDTGRRVREAKGAAVVELVAQGEEEPLWRGVLRAMSGRSFKEEITDASLRKNMLENLSRQLNNLDMPYFIPKSKDILALPAIVE